MKAQLVAVYGTLKHGCCNHSVLQEATFVGSFVTPPSYSMLNIGEYPALITGGSTAIRCEVYRVNQQHMVNLDALEDYPHLYTRRHIETPFGQAWLYLWNQSPQGYPLINHGNWSEG